MIENRIFKTLAVLLFCVLCGAVVGPAQTGTPFSPNEAPIPNNGQPVNDLANIIDDETEQRLNQKIKEFTKRTNPATVIAVVTVQTTGDRGAFDYSLALARGWKIGSKLDNNPSALLFVAIADRKYQTQVSRDLEGELPDGVAGQLQRQHLVPAFKAGNYSKGISDTIDAYIATIDAKRAGLPTPTPQSSSTDPIRGSGLSSSTLTGAICCLVVIIVILALIFSRRGSSRKGRDDDDRWGGGGGFGGGGALPWIVGSIIANSGGSSGGSSWGGGDSGGSGGSDWGGFGGGGDFGGGGAGGDW